MPLEPHSVRKAIVRHPFGLISRSHNAQLVRTVERNLDLIQKRLDLAKKDPMYYKSGIEPINMAIEAAQSAFEHMQGDSKHYSASQNRSLTRIINLLSVRITEDPASIKAALENIETANRLSCGFKLDPKHFP